MKAARAILATLLGLDLVAFAALFFLALARYSATRIMPGLALAWELGEAARGLLLLLPALHLAGAAAAFSLGEDDGREALAAGAAPILACTLIALLLGQGLSPYLRELGEAQLATSARFNRGLQATRVALGNDDIRAARRAFDGLLALDREDARLGELEERLLAAELKAGMAARDKGAGAAPVTKPPRAGAAEPDAESYYRSALRFFDEGDFYSAHWYASRAADLSPRFAEATRLAARAWERVLSGMPPGSDARLYRRKLEAYALLRAGDSLGAYREFTFLRRAFPEDRDVKRYLAESLAALEGSAFFRDEAERATRGRTLAGFSVEPPPAAGGPRELRAREAALSPGALYLFDLELDWGGGGPVLRAPYGKLSGGRLFLLSVERELPEQDYSPDWIVPPADLATKGGPAAPPRGLDVGMEAERAWDLAQARSRPAALHLPKLLGILDEQKSEPASSLAAGLRSELARRLAQAFDLLLAAILGAALGLALRQAERPGKASLAFGWPALLAAAALLGSAHRSVDAAAANAALALGGVGAYAALRGLGLALAFLLLILASGAAGAGEAGGAEAAD